MLTMTENWLCMVYCAVLETDACIEEVLIDFQELVGEHSGANLAAAVWQTIDFYGLASKVFR